MELPPVLLKTILDSITEGVFTVNEDWIITSFNRAAEKITGFSREKAIGKSAALQKIFHLLPDIARSDSSVLIQGPSGSGKELLAQALHQISGNAL